MFKNCLYCNKSYQISPYRHDISFFCSLKCKGLHERIKIKRPCAFCDKIFEHISSRVNKAKYCSRECYHRARIGKGTKEFKCKYCGKSFLDSPSRNRIYCSKKCVNKCEKERFDPKFTTVRKQMLRRGFIQSCDLCGYNTVPNILGVHHKNGDRQNNQKDNLMVLCPNCHSLIHNKHIVH